MDVGFILERTVPRMISIAEALRRHAQTLLLRSEAVHTAHMEGRKQLAPPRNADRGRRQARRRVSACGRRPSPDAVSGVECELDGDVRRQLQGCRSDAIIGRVRTAPHVSVVGSFSS